MNFAHDVKTPRSRRRLLISEASLIREYEAARETDTRDYGALSAEDFALTEKARRA